LTFLNHIFEQSDVYAAQCNSNFHITETELEIFLGELLKMGLSPMPRYSMNRSTEVWCDAIADAGSGRYCVTFILMTTVKRCSPEKVIAKSESSTNHACVWNSKNTSRLTKKSSHIKEEIS
ncbi:hypothetical protein T03_1299, partial [Trichinella britovi]